MKMNRYASFIACLLLMTTACNKEPALAPATSLQSSAASLKQPAAKHFIGEHFGGGIIYYLDSTGKHGLIAAPVDFEEPYAWSYKDRMNGAKDTTFGAGAVNTVRIYNAQGFPQSENNTYAALECMELILNGYEDWYLPSLNELSEMYKNRAVIGGFQLFLYWSSSEANRSQAWLVKFINGVPELQPKTSRYAVRPVRKF